jgi:hypothetical protein
MDQPGCSFCRLEIHGAIQERDGSFLWNRMDYIEYPKGQPGRRLPPD